MYVWVIITHYGDVLRKLRTIGADSHRIFRVRKPDREGYILCSGLNCMSFKYPSSIRHYQEVHHSYLHIDIEFTILQSDLKKRASAFKLG